MNTYCFSGGDILFSFAATKMRFYRQQIQSGFVFVYLLRIKIIKEHNEYTFIKWITD